MTGVATKPTFLGLRPRSPARRLTWGSSMDQSQAHDLRRALGRMAVDLGSVAGAGVVG